jgi:predicted RNase H-like nuclease (RuvC/YqgF family)
VEVIKEVVVEKNSGGDLQPKLDALQNTVQKLKQDNIEKDKKIKEYEKTIQDIQKFQEDKKAMFLRGSNLDDNLYK